jgi:hypothetical protein
MSAVHHEVRITGPDGFRDGLPSALSGALLAAFGTSVEGAVRMAFVGRSRAPGRRRSWLNEAADVRLQDIDRGEEAVLHFTARPFGEIADLAKEMYSQIEMWATRPEPTWSAVDTLAAVIDDVAAERQDSARFDVSLLRHIQRFGRVFGGPVNDVRVEAKHRVDSFSPGFTSLNQPVLEHARALSAATPRPREARIVGVLDMIRQSTQSFALRLDDGEEVRGVMAEGDVGQARTLFGKRVTVQGQAVFRPSGRLLRIDARALMESTDESAFWSKLPNAAPSGRPRARQRLPQTATTGVNAFFGRWPGDESDDALLGLLRGER